MRRFWFPLTAAACLAISAPYTAHAIHRHHVPKTLVAFSSLYGVDGPFVGSANPVRGIPGDGLPWEPPRFVDAKLTTDGLLFIVVRGLVLGADDVVPEDLRLTNPDATFRGVVSCLTEDEDTGTTPP